MPTNQQMAKDLLINFANYEWQPEYGSEGAEIEFPLYAGVLFGLPPEDTKEIAKRLLEKDVEEANNDPNWTGLEFDQAAAIVIRYLDETGFFEE